jgi:hypothetical protein
MAIESLPLGRGAKFSSCPDGPIVIRFVLVFWLGDRKLAIVLALAGAMAASGCTDAGASPEQPIAFPHIAHTENQIDCAFCHEFADRQASAGIPRTELCGSCHSAMAQDSEAARALLEYVDAGEQIAWARLYQLPQFTYFPHKWHVRADIGCEVCHGDIGSSARATRHIRLEMDWCVGCHEERGATVDCVACHQ